MLVRLVCCSALFATLLAAQVGERESLVPEAVPRKQLTEAELQSQVDALKQSLLPKLMGERTATRPEAREKWLAAWRAIQSPHGYGVWQVPIITGVKKAR